MRLTAGSEMPIRKDFQEFVFRGNVVDLAVGVMVGAAFGKIVGAMVDDLVMPIVGALLPAGSEWRTFEVEPAPGMKFRIGHFLGVLIDFFITAMVLFFILVKFVGLLRRKAPAQAPPATKICEQCLEGVAIAAKRCKFCTSALTALALLFLPVMALAQPASPAFKFTPEGEVKVDAPAEKKLQARGGLIQLAGNSEVLTGTLGVQASYQAASNRFSGEAGLAYARSAVITVVDANANGMVDAADLQRRDETTSKLFQAKGRYDRFLTLNNSAYLSLQALTDEPAGKEIVAGGQVGYSRQLWKNDRHRAVVELGYDLSLERAVAAGAGTVQVHSARVLAAEDLKLSEATLLLVSVEALVNLNEEKAPAPDYAPVAALDDTRINARAGLTTQLWKSLAFGFSFGLRYDQAPAPLKAPAGAVFAPTFRPLARTWDTTTEASLVVTFF
jgi:large conductance mechanosensitive channel